MQVRPRLSIRAEIPPNPSNVGYQNLYFIGPKAGEIARYHEPQPVDEALVVGVVVIHSGEHLARVGLGMR